MRVVLVCEEAAGARALGMLAQAGHELAAVLTSETSPVWRLATKLGITPLPARRVREPGFAAILVACRAEVLLNVHSLHIVPAEVLLVPPLGAYNLHPGPLPHYAGLNAPSWAIYHGRNTHAVTLHRMEAGIDTGAIVFMEEFPLEPGDTGLSLALRCTQKGMELIGRLMGLLAAGEMPPLTPQDPAQRRYFGRAAPQGGRIDWNAPARRIHDFVRACDYRPFASPWGEPRAELGGKEVRVIKTALTGERCDAAPGTQDQALVATADQWLKLERFEQS
jgi:UDP-4-amino-4-deoxy-L-arabinose formyltransferase/UDP-glucuronic acid dehydrogenase (UDP-4-keto-hexauronic acid decarboxylating)